MPKTIKNSFAGGELSTDLDGRTDLAKYATGAQLLENFFVTRFGGVSNRAGTQYATKSLRTSSATARSARLIPFQFNVQQGYILEFTNNIMRVFKGGSIVLTNRQGGNYTWTASAGGTDEWYLKTSGANPFSDGTSVNECWEDGTIMTQGGSVGALTAGQWALGDNDSLGYTTLYVRLTATGDPDTEAVVSTDYQLYTGIAAAKIPYIRYTQSADTLFLAQADATNKTQPAKITRTADDAWTYTAMTFTPTGTTPTDFYGSKTGFSTTARQVLYTVASLDSLNRESLPATNVTLDIDLNWVDTTDRVDLFWNNITDGLESTPIFQWTRVGATAEYYLQLSGGSDPQIDEPNAVYEDKVAMSLGTVTSLTAGQYWYGDNDGLGYNTIYVRITADADPDTKAVGYITYTKSTDVQWRVYKNYRGDWGWVGDVDKPWFLDDNVEPNVSIAPKSNEDPFNTGDTDDYPGAVSLYEQRLIYARSNNNPQRVWASTVGDLNNFAKSRPFSADDPITVTLDSGGRMDEIKHLLTLRDALMVFTNGSEWSVGRGDQSSLTPYTVEFKNEGYEGVSDIIEPIGIGNRAIFVQRDNKQIMGLGYNLDDGGYPSAQLNLLAQHLFEDNEIVDWCYQQHPHNIVWLIMDDGTMVSMTYLPQQELIAFTRHSTDGYYRACGSIINGTTNDVYFIIERIINGSIVNFVETLNSREFGDNVRDAKFLDSALTYTSSSTITNVVPDVNKITVTSASHGLVTGDYVLIDYVRGITATGNNAEYSQFNDRYYKVQKLNNNAFYLQDLAGNLLTNDTFTGTFISATLYPKGESGTAYKCAKTVSGLDHLEGETVTALCDGNVVTDLTVSSGSVTVDSASDTPGFGVIHVGIPYNANLQTLRFELATGANTIQTSRKNIKKLTMRFKDSVGGFAGPDSSNLTRIKWRQNEEWTVPNALKTEDVDHKIASTWDKEGRIYFRQSEPLPTTILAVVMEYDLGE